MHSMLPINKTAHPLVKKKYILPTPSIDEFFSKVIKCIQLLTPGALIYSHPRYGKTYAIRYVASVLKEVFPEIVVRSFLCEEKKRPSEDAFFSNLNESFGHKNPLTGTIPKKRSRLINMLREAVENSGQNTLVVFADEAQKLTSIEYGWLRDIHDQLERKGVRMVAFLVGQHTLRNQKSAFKEAGETQIVARFMLDELQFRGLLTVDDAATCLAGYDNSYFPEGGDWCYTRHFFEEAYADGLRMVEQAIPLWDAFEREHNENGFMFDTEIPMQYFARAVEIAILENTDKDSPDFRFSPAIWTQAVRDSKYIEAHEIVSLGLEDAKTLWP